MNFKRRHPRSRIGGCGCCTNPRRMYGNARAALTRKELALRNWRSEVAA